MFLGFSLNAEANQANVNMLNKTSSKPVLIIPADEDAEIVRLVLICMPLKKLFN